MQRPLFLWDKMEEINMLTIKQVILVIFMILIASSCSSVQTKIELSKKYKMDISIRNKEFYGDGVLVLPRKPLYSIIFESEGKLDLFIFRTCSREIAIEDARRGLDRKEVLINYSPNEIEARGACPVDIGAYDEKGRHAWGLIDFEDPETTLPASLVCGKSTSDFNGVSICQERAGLIQKIKFPVDVVVSPDQGCEIGNKSGKEFEFPINLGLCVYAFMERNPPHRIHRATFYGFEELIIQR